MMSHSFQVDTDKLQTIIELFNQQAEEATSATRQLEDCLAALRDTPWDGPGSTHFLARMDDEIMPRMIRIRDSLGASGTALGEFLTQMIGIQPALDKLQQGMPTIEAARDKIKDHIEKLKQQDPDATMRAFQQFLREQGLDNDPDAR